MIIILISLAVQKADGKGNKVSFSASIRQQRQTSLDRINKSISSLYSGPIFILILIPKHLLSIFDGRLQTFRSLQIPMRKISCMI